MIPRVIAFSASCLALLALGVAAAGDAHAAPGDKKTLILRGRITDGENWPIPDVRVAVSGDRKANAQSDPSGQYELRVALGTPADLAKHPLSLHVRAALHGWKITVPGGDAEAGIEMRLASGDDGVVRCEIRTNQPRVTSALARALMSDGDASGLGPLNFFAEHGRPDDPPPAPDLNAIDRVALAGIAPTAVRPAESPAQAPAPAPEKSAPAPSAPEPKPPAPTPAPTPAPSGGDAARALAESHQRDREEADRLRREAKERKEAEREAERLLAAEREAHKSRWDAIQNEVHLMAGAADTTPAPPVRVLEHLAGNPSRAEHRGRATPRRAVVASRDTVRVDPPRTLPEPADPPPSSHAAVPSGPVARTGGPRIFPSPEGEARARAAPLLIRNPSSAAASPPVAAATETPAADTCGCRIEGTIEVRGERPLASRQRVAVSLIWYPAIADTVELFMGSPRAFHLPPAPCGPQRLKITSLGSQSFDIVSREAMAGFKCETGARHQLRLVLAQR
ncbi:MAG: hypothetical protein HYR74_00700 [Candidatus Eisenbacteria bacterium]|nr:hypothetical protein [Candidatus Eisenbacteria bacterium]